MNLTKRDKTVLDVLILYAETQDEAEFEISNYEISKLAEVRKLAQISHCLFKLKKLGLIKTKQNGQLRLIQLI